MSNETLTYRRTRSWKTLLLMSIVFALATNILILVGLLIDGIEWTYYIAPGVLCVLDGILLFQAIHTNFRFKYSLRGTITYAVFVTATIAVTFVLRYGEDKGRIFTSAAEIFWAITHAFAAVTVLMSAFRAAKLNKFAIYGSIAFFVAFAGLSAGYGGYVLKEGYFGQQVDGVVKPLVYTYDEEDDSYTVSGVATSKGDTLVIPENFNGKKVASVDCGIFSVKGVKTVRLECATDIRFAEIEKLENMRTGLSVYIQKADYDTVRHAIFAHVAEKNSDRELLTLAKNMYPSGLAAGEKFVSFNYTVNSLNLIKEFSEENRKYMPTWYGDASKTFSLDFCQETVEYVKYSDKTNNEHLHWAFENNDRYILSSIDLGDNLTDTNTVVEDVSNFDVEFERVYRISIGADNDGVYETPDSVRSTTLASGSVPLPYRYTTLKQANEIQNELPLRTGFSLAWKYIPGVKTDGFAAEDKGSAMSFSTLSEVLDSSDNEDSDGVTVYPAWTLSAPTITEIKTNLENNAVVYGEDITLSSTAEHENTDIKLSYTWTKGSSTNTLSDENTYEIEKTKFTQKGDYTVTVVASNSEFTSLTSWTQASLEVSVNKRALPFAWELPEGNDAIYSATDKIVSATHATSQVIYNDQITYSIYNGGNVYAYVSYDENTSNWIWDYDDSNTIRNANTYDLDVRLTGTCANKYEIPTEDRTSELTIAPYEVALVWESETPSYIYNGNTFCPTATAMGLGDDGSLGILYEGAQRNAGLYEATATLSDTNYRPTAETSSIDYEITKRIIAVDVWEPTTEFNYDGYQKGRIVYFLKDITLANGDDPQNTDILSVEHEEVVHSLQYEGYQTNVKRDEENPDTILSYEMSVKLPDQSNYEFTEDESVANLTVSFKILPIELTLQVEAKEMTYSGKTYTDTGYEYSHSVYGLAETDRANEVYTDVAYTGEAVEAINVGYYSIGMEYEDAEKAVNYNISVSTENLNITKRLLNIQIDDKTHVYDGYAFAEGYTYTVGDPTTNSGLVDGDWIDEVFEPEYTGEAITATNVRTGIENYYYISANNTLSGVKTNNYDITIFQGLLTIAPCEIEVEWTVESEGYVYDGTAHNPEVYATGVLNETVGIYLSSPEYNVGEYTATAEPTSANYTFANPEQAFKIIPREISLVWSSETWLDYNGYEQGVYVTEVINAVSGEEYTIIYNLLEYTGKQMHVGSDYEMTASLISGVGTNFMVNYVLADDGSNKCAYEILPVDLTVTLLASNSEYNGSAYTNVAYSYGYLKGNDIISEIFVPEYHFTDSNGEPIEQKNLKNAGTYEVEAENVCTKIKKGNYNITVDPSAFEILPKQLTLNVTANSRGYNGEEYEDSDFGVSVVGYVNADRNYDFFTEGSLLYEVYDSENALTIALNAGSYTVQLSGYELSEENGIANNYTVGAINSTTFNISKVALTIKMVAKTSGIVYNGEVFDDFEYTMTGSYYNEEDFGEPTYTTKINNVDTEPRNAGTYVMGLLFENMSETVPLNYVITYRTANLKIEKKTVNITWNPVDTSGVYNAASSRWDFTYDETEKEMTPSTEDFIEGDDVSFVLSYYRGSTKLSYVPSAVGTAYRARVTSLTGEDASNYSLVSSTASVSFAIIEAADEE